MNRLSNQRRTQIIACLVEGNSVRSTCRMTGSDKGTVLRLLANLGAACREYMADTMRELPCRRLEVDELWAFCYGKEKNIPEDLRGQFGFGDTWTFTAICADTKLVPCFRVGRRDYLNAREFMCDLSSRLKNRIQLTTDGHKMYVQAVEDAFGDDVDFAQLHKLYGADIEQEKRYSPPKCIGAKKERVNGKPNRKHISTSYVERANLTIRMQNRRFTRLTNAFSKKVENLEHSLAIQFIHYNFCRVHQTLRVTPAMEAGIADHVWELDELVSLLDGREWRGRGK